ncbi:MAG: DUF4340 domain-containing protein [Candidatus Krumholzibacteriota bacterium]|nr:DUF4340 domain-containing protein [Candidatus Krumholzibacteriota bacterium]
MKFRSTVFLVLLLAIIISYFFLFDQKQLRHQQWQRVASRQVLPYGPAEVDSVVFTNPQGDVIHWRRQGEGWLITFPTVTAGSSPTIDAFLTQILPGKKTTPIPDVDVKSLADFGLQDPFAGLIIYNGTRGRVDTLYIGDKTPVGDNCYIRLGSSREVLVSREMTRNMMNKSLYHMRDKNFLRIDTRLIKELRISRPRLEVSLGWDGVEWITTGNGFLADKLLIEKYLTALVDAIVYRFSEQYTDQAGDYGLGRPRRELTIITVTDKILISFGRVDNNFVYVTRTGIDHVMSIKAEFQEIFNWTIKDIEQRSISLFRPGEVSQIDYQSADTTLHLTLLDKTWKSGDPRDPELSTYQVNDLLRLLRGLKYNRLISRPDTYPDRRFENYDLRLTLKKESGELLDAITFKRTADGGVVASSLELRTAGEVTADMLSEIFHIFSLIGSSG